MIEINKSDIHNEAVSSDSKIKWNSSNFTKPNIRMASFFNLPEI